jgi:3-oxoacyl-[acyl-carrier protein] reductase
MPNVLITGCSRGIGLAMVEHFLNKGWQVFGCSRSTPGLTSAMFTHVQLDLNDKGAAQKLLHSLSERISRLDVLINNAGTASMSPFALQPEASMRSMFDLNFHASALVTHQALRMLRRADHPRIINFSTVAVPYRLMGEAVYSASKAAIEQWTRVLAHELGSFKITVNAVGPTPIRTDLLRGIPEHKLQELLDRQAIRRWGTMEDVINVVDFFAKPESDFITGQVVYLGGAG